VRNGSAIPSKSPTQSKSTHEQSEQNVCGESLNRNKPTKRCRKAIEELQKNQLQSGVGAEYSAPLLLQKMFELFGGDHFFYSNNFP
jgi:hypothetical protein